MGGGTGGITGPVTPSSSPPAYPVPDFLFAAALRMLRPKPSRLDLSEGNPSYEASAAARLLDRMRAMRSKVSDRAAAGRPPAGRRGSVGLAEATDESAWTPVTDGEERGGGCRGRDGEVGCRRRGVGDGDGDGGGWRSGGGRGGGTGSGSRLRIIGRHR